MLIKEIDLKSYLSTNIYIVVITWSAVRVTHADGNGIGGA